jgi:type I pantothenate kinase
MKKRPDANPNRSVATDDQIAVQMTESQDFSPYLRFTRSEWASLRADTPLTLTDDDLGKLHSINDPISMEDVSEIYLPLSRLLSLYVAATQGLFEATKSFLGANGGKTPYVVGIAGSVSAGKSTTSRVLRTLLSRWPHTPKVDLVTTDGFLHPNEVLLANGLMERKGFPESYDTAKLLRFVAAVKAGERAVAAPVYSHLAYDVVPDQQMIVDRPDILILEGLNVLAANKSGAEISFVSDFFDFSIYLHAEESDLESWYVTRFMHLRQTAFRNPDSYFHKYASLSDQNAIQIALSIWRNINLKNLRENIAPTKGRASLILTKDQTHRIKEVALRKL